MQGQRNSVEPFTDVFGFDHGSSSSNSGMDQNAYWNNMLLSPVESQNLQGYLMNRSDAIPTIQYENESRQDGPLFGFWESGEASSSGSSLNYGISSEIKREHLNIGGGLRINERRLEAEHTLSLENVDIDLNTNGNDLCGQSSSGNNAPRGSEQYSGLGGGGTNVEVSGLRLHPHGAVILDTEQMQSFAPLNSYENPLGNFSLMQEDIDPRPGSSLDGRRLACKRKNIEGIHGQCSASASTSFSHRNDNIFPNIASSSSSSAPGSNMPTPPSCFLAPSSTEEQFPCFGATSGLLSSSYDPSGGNNPGSSQRSFRARTSAAQQIAPYGIWPSSSIARHFNSWTHQPALHQSTFDEPSGVVPMASNSTLQYQHPVNVVPGIPQGTHRFVRRGASTSRVGSLSNSASSENRILGTTEEPSGRNVVAANFSDSVPQVDMRHFVPEPSNWNGDGRGTAFAGNIPSASRTNANLLVNPPAGSAWTAHQNMHRRHPRNLAEEIGRLSGALRGHQSPRLRSGFLLERQGDGVWGVPLSSRSREGRRLMEIRNALEMIHRGENVRLESIIYGGVDIHDRHRDMRLDIDNMSYEELLALEERIGNVNTGLSEEVVTKLLKQRKFSSMRAEASLEHEPCCVCQEEYVDGEELGTLDCGHDFHAGCIMQWLLLKNLCPICKNTALKT